MTKFAWLVAGILPLCQYAAANEMPAGEAGKVRTVVENTVNSIINVLKDKAKDRDQRRTEIFAIVDPVVDFALMGKLALGREHWSEFKEAQHKEFIGSFSTAVRDSCFEKVEIYTNETAEFDAPAPSGKGKHQMMMRIFSKGQRYKVLFKLYHAAASWKIYDLEIEGISLVRTYAAQYDQVLQKGSPQDLLAKLKAKALATPDELKHVARPKAKAGKP